MKQNKTIKFKASSHCRVKFSLKIKKEWIIYISIAIATILLNALAWNSKAFCDAYIAYIFPVWVNTYGRITGIFPISVGEWMLVAGVILVVVAGMLGILWLVQGLWRMVRYIYYTVCRKKGDGLFKEACLSKGNGLFAGESVSEGESLSAEACISTGTDLSHVKCIFKKTKKYYHFFAWVILIVSVIMTLNCTILYHASTFSEKYFGEDTEEYSLEQCIQVYNHIAEACNRLSAEMTRDAEGKIVYVEEWGAKTRNQMADEAIQAMQNLGKTYPQLDGWYPRPKPMAFSDFMCQQYMCGYYFPFSMEANYNDVMYIMNKPATMCHELAHLRGYIFEDEANFISYLACVESEDIMFQYSGYLSVLVYLHNDLYYAKQSEPEVFAKATQKTALVQVQPKVWEDNVFVEQSEWDRINSKALIDTETVDEVSDTFTDTTLKLNGVSDGMVSYSRVVRLLLQYYASRDMI